MRWSFSSSRWSLAVVGVLVLLLAVLATLQYRWIAQLSEAERARLQEGLDQAAAGYCEDFDREVARAYSVFSLVRRDGERGLSQVLAARLAEWRSSAEWPALVGGLYVVRLLETGEIALLCFDEESQALHRCDWQHELLPIRRHLGDSGPRVPVIDGALPGLVLAIEEREVPNAQPPQRRPPRDHLVVRFDLDYIAGTVLPGLAEVHFAANGSQPYLLDVVSVDRPREAIFQTTPGPPAGETGPDSTGVLFGLRSFPGISSSAGGGMRGRRPPPPGRDRGRGEATGRQHPPPPELHARTEEGRWVLAVRHPEGSLEIVVAQARRRNMAISAAMLFMLGVTAALMLASTRSARRLARQQMDFVAAVSHELKTPLTAMRSAGQNLADGIVSDPDGVQNYGRLIEREGRRLTEMIGRVLTFAGIRSGRQIFRKQAVDLAEVVEAVLRDSEAAFEENAFEVHSEIDDDLPPVIGDQVALRQVVSNLIENALKYATDGRWLGVRVRFHPAVEGGEVTISISDRGPGVPSRERSAIFEPFRRGVDAVGSGISGSGLGLSVVRSIVEAHGGSIKVDSAREGGATFVVRLPAERGEGG